MNDKTLGSPARPSRIEDRERNEPEETLTARIRKDVMVLGK
jgi:hypothetical protein